MNEDLLENLKKAIIESGSTIAFVVLFLYSPFLASVLFLISYLTNKQK